MLEIRDLCVAYGPIEAVRDITIDVERGQIVAILGANGAGKSSLLGAIAGLVPVARGSVTHDGDEIVGLAAERVARRGIALVPEGRRIFPELTVSENLWMGAAAVRSRAERERRRNAVVERFPVLAARAQSPAGQLSGGQQQMLAIGRALMSAPPVLLLDEPSLGLAPIIVKEIFELIGDLRDDDVTVLIVEQNAHKALALADQAYVLRGGRAVMSGTAEQVAQSMDLRSAYLGYDETEAAR
jgi:branched-chain amino acid transport system ATP-binding protein